VSWHEGRSVCVGLLLLWLPSPLWFLAGELAFRPGNDQIL